MEIFGIDVIGLVTNPAGALVGGAVGIIIFQVYKILMGMFSPVQYVRKLYKIADNIVLNADKQLINKIGNKQVKADLEAKLVAVLNERPEDIKKLIASIKS